SLLQSSLHFARTRTGELRADAFAREVTRQLVQPQRDFKALLAGHLAVAFDLGFKGGFGSHRNGRRLANRCVPSMTRGLRSVAAPGQWLANLRLESSPMALRHVWLSSWSSFLSFILLMLSPLRE